MQLLIPQCLAAGLVAAVLLITATPRATSAQEAIPLINPADAKAGWTFDNGQEFPGATGLLTADPGNPNEPKPGLKLEGDFSAGGRYVQAGRKLDRVDVRELAMWVRNPDAESFTIRLIDGGGQVHQIVLKTEPGPQWQRVVLPLERFFARRGHADAVANVAKYESWGGEKDGEWHGPATGIYFIVGKPPAATKRTFWLSDLTIVPRPTEAAGVEQAVVLRLDETIDGNHDWSVSLGGEVPGAKGSLSVAKNTPAAGQTALKLAGDFTGGGAYVAAIKKVAELDVKDVTAFRLRVKTENAAAISIQLVDGTGQTHQRKGVKLTADGAWHELVIRPKTIAGGEHWGGANDGKWHGPPRQLVLSVTRDSDKTSRQPVVYLADVQAEMMLPVFIQPPAFKESFEKRATPATGAAGAPTGGIPPGWTASGMVSIDQASGFQSVSSLRLTRSLEDIDKPCTATSPPFPVAGGTWQVGLAHRSDLHSPDNSYNAVVQMECLDSAGKSIERITVADVFGKHGWQQASKRVELPKGATTARFNVQLNKTHGSFHIDELSAAFLSPAPRRDDRIARLLFSTARLGNLLLPDDPRTVNVTVECRKPLRDDQRTLSYVVRDYWGAEQIQPATVALGNAEKKGDRFVYIATIDLAGARPSQAGLGTPASPPASPSAESNKERPAEDARTPHTAGLGIGRYYELHAWVSQGHGEPFRNHTSLAILPEAETKRYKPEDVPFSSRNWDNRSAEFMRLSDRLGIRICGVWGSWSAKAPYKAEAPGLDLVKELGMGWLTTTPAKLIERGSTEYSEEALRQGVRNLIEKYGHVRPMIINLGNEPHGTGERVLKNVEAYRAIYEEVKKVDPSIPVVATSVEPNEEYFRAGYGKWCDAYDFHIYESAADVRRTMQQYKGLMKQYGQEKPLWSTEVGLNSQGMTRHAVAMEVMKKLCVFFAEGGANVSWFGILYPDPEGKNEGSSGQAHNVFDSRFNRYCPKLDAIALYNAVNAIGIKKFAAERQYPDGVQAFLFRDRDGRCLQVLWADRGRHDVAVPLAGVKQVQLVRIDGSRRVLKVEGREVTVTVSEEPLLLLYDGGPAGLPETLNLPSARIEIVPAAVGRREPIKLTVMNPGVFPDDVTMVAPPFWTVEKSLTVTAGQVTFALSPPASNSAHQADFTVTLARDGARTGELYWRVPVRDE